MTTTPPSATPSLITWAELVNLVTWAYGPEYAAMEIPHLAQGGAVGVYISPAGSMTFGEAGHDAGDEMFAMYVHHAEMLR